MLKILFGIFTILHGLVHMLYFGQSARYFELQPGMVWPDGSWAFSKLLGVEPVRMLANIMLILAAAGFVVSGIGILAGLTWWRPVIIGTAIFSSLIYLLFWNGMFKHLDNQGAIGILLNLAILAIILIFHWPKP